MATTNDTQLDPRTDLERYQDFQEAYAEYSYEQQCELWEDSARDPEF
jgi:hypothetical protein